MSQFDETVLEKYVDRARRSPPTDLRRAIRTATVSGEVVPVLCGSAFKNKGVQPLLDAVVDYLPSPVDVPPIVGTDVKSGEAAERPPDDERALRRAGVQDHRATPTSASSRTSASTRASSGRAAQMLNATKDRKERVGRILQMHANHREDIDGVFAGDIVAVVGLKDTTTGDTLCDPAHPIVLERMEFPEPVIWVAIEPKTKADQDKLGKALGALSEEDPTFQVRTDEETGQTIIAGMGELHLDVLVDRMTREFRSRRTSASRRSPTARRSPRPSRRSRSATSARPAATASTATS